jgi:hypothetical protein
MMTARAIFSLLLVGWSVGSSQPSQTIGDTSDGSRSTPVHLIKIYDEFDHLIRPDDRPAMPYSPRTTCGKCHGYETIRGGWHFNWADSGVAPGRAGEPWIYVNPSAATQVPMSTRQWAGAYHPSAFGLTTMKFLSTFGRHLPGGGSGELGKLHEMDDYMRWEVSGDLEINCQSCHNADPAQNQAEYGVQVLRENFRWAPAASGGFAVVRGSARDMPDNFDLYSAVPPEKSGVLPPTVLYQSSRFDTSGRVLFSVPRRMPPSQCYFCHSSKVIDPARPDRWGGDEDVHLAAGMSCVDCHRNGLNHRIVRGYEGEKLAGGESVSVSLSCRGCHLGDDESGLPGEGRRRAPRPEHAGIPPVHFEKLSCTLCHSGPWPSGVTYRVKTSRAHALGIPRADKADDAPPHVASPVFVREADGTFVPCNVVWPAFWAYEREGEHRPIDPTEIAPHVKAILEADTLQTGARWPVMNEADILTVLNQLRDSTRGSPVYVAGGRVHGLGESGRLSAVDHDVALPYAWPIAHDVRPKGQSLGVRGCGDCHATDSPVYFGSVRVGSPFFAVRDSLVGMTAFQDRSPVIPWMFSASFLFRPWLKVVIIIGFVVIAGVLMLYGLRGLGAIVKTLDPGGE